MSLITTYLKLTKEYSEKYGDRTVILMMVGSFYEIYGEKTSNSDGSFNITGSKIDEISKLCDLSIANKTGQYVMAGFTYTKIDKYLKKINGIKHRNEPIFNVQFFPWEKAGEAFTIYYPVIGRACISTQKTVETFEMIHK